MASTAFTKAVRNAFPRQAGFLAHLKALFQNEVELRLLPWLCARNEAAVDAGAYTGTYTIGLSIFAKSVLAVEPQPRQAAALRRAIPRNATVAEVALSNVVGIGNMELSSPDGGSMSKLVTHAGMRDWPKVSVKLSRLDDLRTECIGFVKIDVEGHEAEVLRGATYILQNDKPNLLIEAEERNDPGSVARVTNLLKGYGYDGYFVRRDSIVPISEFGLDRDQNPQLLVGGQRRFYRDYINNFIFLHPDRGTKLPAHVPPSWMALFKTFGVLFRGDRE